MATHGSISLKPVAACPRGTLRQRFGRHRSERDPKSLCKLRDRLRHRADRFAARAGPFACRADDFAFQVGPFARWAGDFAFQAGLFARRADDFASRAGPFACRADDFAFRAGPFARGVDDFALSAGHFAVRRKWRSLIRNQPDTRQLRRKEPASGREALTGTQTLPGPGAEAPGFVCDRRSHRIRTSQRSRRTSERPFTDFPVVPADLAVVGTRFCGALPGFAGTEGGP